MTLEDRVHALRLRLFQRAEELSYVSAACREAGVSRSAYYQLRQRFPRYGADGLYPEHRTGRPGRPPNGHIWKVVASRSASEFESGLAGFYE